MHKESYTTNLRNLRNVGGFSQVSARAKNNVAIEAFSLSPKYNSTL
jgi:hypothetical protein